MKTAIQSLTLIALLIGTGSVAHAHVATNAELTADAVAQTSTNLLDSMIGASTSVDAEVQADVDAGASSNTDADGEMHSTSSADAESSTEAEVTLPMLRVSLGSDARAATQVQNSAQVQSDADLSLYAQSVLARNDAIERVEADSNTVEIRFNEKAKLFGFIPVTLTNRAVATIDADANGEVHITTKVKKSPLRFFAKSETNINDLAAKAQARVESAAQLSAGARASVDAQVYAEVLEALEASVQESLAAETSADL